MKLKRIMAIVLCFAMVLSTMSFNVFASDDTVTYAEAFAAALTAGGTVVLDEDVEINETIEIPADVEVVLDLNGKTITSGYQEGFGEDSESPKHIYPLDIYGTVTIKDSLGEGSVSGRGIYVQEGANLTVESGTIYGIDGNGGSALYQYGGDIVIEGGLIEQTADYTYNYAIYAGGGTITVNDGNIVGKHGAISVSGAAVTLNDGELICTGNNGWTDNVVYVSGGSFTMTGGTVLHKGQEVSADSGAGVVAADDDVTIAISGGSVTGLNGALSGNSNTTVTGGTFIHGAYGTNHYSDVSDYVPEGFEYDPETGSVVESEPEAPAQQTGTVTPCYTDENSFWGEATTNSTSELTIKVYEGDKVIAKTSLTDKDNLKDGDVYVTWHINFGENNDEYWDVEWAEGYPNINMAPTKVTVTVDGEEVDDNVFCFGNPDYENNIVALAEDRNGKFLGAYKTLADAMGKFNSRTVRIVRDVNESITGFYGVTLIGNDVTVTNPYDEDWIDFDDVTVSSGVTLDMDNIYAGDSENVIEGNLIIRDTLYHGYDAKTTVQNGGSIKVNGSTVLRYNKDADAGLYIYGDGKAETVEFDCGYYIGAYSGTFYAEDATIETGYYLLKNSYDDDNYADIALTLDNSTITVVGTSDTQDSFIIDDKASVTMKNSSAIKDVRDFNILTGTSLTFDVDSTSTISATNMNIAEDVPFVAVENADGTFGIAKAPKTSLDGEGTEESPYLINDIDDLKFFRDKVNEGNDYKGKYFRLENNIDLSSEENWTPIGATGSHANNYTFRGYFDGNEKTISNLTISDTTSTEDKLGLFGHIHGSAMNNTVEPSVKDLNLTNVNITSTDTKSRVGGLAGNPYTCYIKNVHVSGTISGGKWTGGIAGNCYTYFENCSFTGKVVSPSQAGGIAGAGDVRAYNCAVYANVESGYQVGGIVGNGQEGTSIVGCYVEGDISADNSWYYSIGGIAGWAGHGYDGSEIKNNYFNGNVYLADEKINVPLIGALNASNADIKTEVSGNSWNTDNYPADLKAVVVGCDEFADNTFDFEKYASTAKEQDDRNNNLVMLESDLEYIDAKNADDVTIMTFSEVTKDQVAEAVKANNSSIKVTYKDGTVEYFNDMREAVPHTTNYDKLEGATITLLKDTSGLGMRFMENGMVFDLNGHTYTLTGGTGSKGTETSAFQIRPEVTETATIKNGTIKLAENVNICWIFNNYATNFVVENVVVDCANLDYDGYDENCYVHVSREGDNTNLTGTTKFINFNSDVAGNAINVGGTMTIEDTVDLADLTVELDAGATLTAKDALNVVAVDGYRVVNTNGVYTTEAISYIAQVDNVKYETLTEALKALTDGATLTLLDDVTVSEAWDCRYNGAKITANNVTIDGNGKTLKLTGNVDDKNWNTVFRVEGDNATFKNLTIDASEAASIQRGISTKLSVTLSGCNLIGNGTTAKRGLIYGEGAGTAISNVTVNVTNTNFTNWSYGLSDNQSGNDAKSVNITGGTFTNSKILVSAHDAVTTGGMTMDNSWINVTSYTVPNTLLADVSYSDWEKNTAENQNRINAAEIYGAEDAEYFMTPVAENNGKLYLEFADAVNKAAEGETVKLLKDVELTESIMIDDTVTFDLNGKTITGTDNNTKGNFYLFDNRGNLTITGNGKITLTAANDRDWKASSVIVANNPGGKLVVENGTFEHLGGTDMAYAIDNLTNGKGTYAETIINGGVIKSTYRAVRQFLNGIEAQNILTVNGGTIEGANKSIWMQDPSKNANTGTLTVGENAVLSGDVYLTVTEGSTEWPVEVKIAEAAVKSKVLTNEHIPNGYELVNENGFYGIKNSTSSGYTITSIASQSEVRYNNNNTADSFTVKYVAAGGEVFGAMAQFEYDTELFECKEDPNATGIIRMANLNLTPDANGETLLKELHFTVKKDVEVDTTYTFVAKYVQVVGNYVDAGAGTQNGFVENLISDNVTIIAQYDATLDNEGSIGGNNYVDHNADYTGTINNFDENKIYTITYTMGEEEYTIEVEDETFVIEDVTGDIVFTEITSMLNFELVILPDVITGYTLVMVKDGVSAGYTYNGAEMYAVERYVGLTEIAENEDRSEFVGGDILGAESVRAILIEGGVTLDEARAAIEVSATASKSLEESFDVNCDGAFWYNDAVTAHGCYKSQYALAARMNWYLSSDVNTDFMIDGDDYDDAVTAFWSTINQ